MNSRLRKQNSSLILAAHASTGDELRGNTFFRRRLRNPTIVGRFSVRLVSGVFFLFTHVSKPRAWRGALAFCDLEKHFLNLRRDFAAFTITDRNAIDRANRCNLCRRAAEEQLVRDIQRCALNTSLLGGQYQVRCKSESRCRE